MMAKHAVLTELAEIGMTIDKVPDSETESVRSCDVRIGLAAMTGLILLGLALLLRETFYMSPPLLPGYPGDAFFPRLVLIPTIVFASIILFRVIVVRSSPEDLGYLEPTIVVQWISWLTVFALCIAFAWALDRVGFEISAFVLMMALLIPRLAVTVPSSPARVVALAVAYSVATIGTIYLTFVVLLKVPLPLLILPAYLL